MIAGVIASVSSSAQFDFFSSLANLFRPSSNNISNNNSNRGPGGCAAGGNPANYRSGQNASDDYELLIIFQGSEVVNIYLVGDWDVPALQNLQLRTFADKIT